MIFENIPASTEVADTDEFIIEDESSTALILYTSGTTGNPKGVMLSFKNLLANLNAVCRDVPIYVEGDRIMILLPFHHILPAGRNHRCTALFRGYHGAEYFPRCRRPDGNPEAV